MHCHLDLKGLEIMYISLALGLLSCLDAVRISLKVRRVIMYSCMSYLFINCYAALLRTSDTSQLNLIELVLRKHAHVSLILGSEFILILITKTIIFSILQEVIRTLNRMIEGGSARHRRTATRRSDAYIYVPDRPRSPENARPGIKRVKFTE